MLNAIGVLNATRFNKQMLIENPGCGHENVGWVAGLPGFTSSDFFTCDTCFWFFFSQHRSLSYKSTYFIFHVPHLTFPNASLLCRRNARRLLLPLGQGFSTLTLWIFRVDNSLLWKGCPVYYRIFRNIPGIFPFLHILTLVNVSWEPLGYWKSQNYCCHALRKLVFQFACGRDRSA